MPQEHYQRAHAFSTIPIIHPALFFDDSSGTFNWIPCAEGDDYTAEYDPVAAFVQLNGILLKTKLTTPAINDYVQIERHLWLPPLGILRLQVMFCLLSYRPYQKIELILIWYDKLSQHAAGLQLMGHTDAVGYLTGYSVPNFSYTTIPYLRLTHGSNLWNKVDLSVNPLTDTYHRIQVNERVLDGSPYPIFVEATAVPQELMLLIKTTTLEAVQATAYIDQILLTQEAP